MKLHLQVDDGVSLCNKHRSLTPSVQFAKRLAEVTCLQCLREFNYLKHLIKKGAITKQDLIDLFDEVMDA